MISDLRSIKKQNDLTACKELHASVVSVSICASDHVCGGVSSLITHSITSTLRTRESMALPDFQTIMLPLLRRISDGRDWAMRDVTRGIEDEFGLTTEERSAMLPSGYSRVIVNRVGWAKSYMKEAGLIQSVRRGFVKITEDGQKVLVSPPDRIDMKFLEQFPSFLAFRSRSSSEGDQVVEPEESESLVETTPDEQIETAYSALQAALIAELLDQILEMSDRFFEKLVVELLVAMGYGGSIADAGRAVGKSGDGGIDGVIKEDKLGLDVIVLQAKRWTSNAVGRPDIQAFVGSMEAYRANKGVFITTSTFSAPAYEYVKQIQRKISLIDGKMLAELMIDNGVGVSTYRAIHLKRLDTDYFVE